MKGPETAPHLKSTAEMEISRTADLHQNILLAAVVDSIQASPETTPQCANGKALGPAVLTERDEPQRWHSKACRPAICAGA